MYFSAGGRPPLDICAYALPTDPKSGRCEFSLLNDDRSKRPVKWKRDTSGLLNRKSMRENEAPLIEQAWSKDSKQRYAADGAPGFLAIFHPDKATREREAPLLTILTAVPPWAHPTGLHRSTCALKWVEIDFPSACSPGSWTVAMNGFPGASRIPRKRTSEFQSADLWLGSFREILVVLLRMRKMRIWAPLPLHLFPVWRPNSAELFQRWPDCGKTSAFSKVRFFAQCAACRANCPAETKQWGGQRSKHFANGVKR